MELLTRNNFEGWMQKLMERLDRQDELLLAMKAEGKQPTITESIRLFDNQDLCMLLQISKRTLQRYRSVGALPYKTLGKKTYYSEEDVLTFLSNHIKDFKKEDIAFYKARIHNFFHNYEVCRYMQLENGLYADVYALEIIIPVAFRLNTYNTHLFRTWLVGKALAKEKRQAYVMFIQNGKAGYC